MLLCNVLCGWISGFKFHQPRSLTPIKGVTFSYALHIQATKFNNSSDYLTVKQLVLDYETFFSPHQNKSDENNNICRSADADSLKCD